MAPRTEAAVCLACGKKFCKTDYSLQCTVCGLWAHKTCVGMTDELFNMIDLQLKQTGKTYWACRSCTAYAEGMNHRVRQIELELAEVKKACEKSDCGLRDVQEKVGKLSDEVKKQAKKLEESAEAVSSNSITQEEWKEREMRRKNVVMYGMGEAPEEQTGRERWDWDKASCFNLFRALKVKIQEDGVRFVRRVGEKGVEPRPLVVGFYEEGDKTRLLRSDTRNTPFSNVDIGPDLTKQQRQEEFNLRGEAARRNMRMTREDAAKNLAWQVVGPRGEKRLEKRFVDMEKERSSRGRGAPRGGRAAFRGRAPPRTGTGANHVPLGTRGNETEEMEFEGGEEEERVASQDGTTRGRGRPRGRGFQGGPTHKTRSISKRKEMEAREGDEEEEEYLPPAKH